MSSAFLKYPGMVSGQGLFPQEIVVPICSTVVTVQQLRGVLKAHLLEGATPRFGTGWDLRCNRIAGEKLEGWRQKAGENLRDDFFGFVITAQVQAEQSHMVEEIRGSPVEQLNGANGGVGRAVNNAPADVIPHCILTEPECNAVFHILGPRHIEIAGAVITVEDRHSGGVRIDFQQVVPVLHAGLTQEVMGGGEFRAGFVNIHNRRSFRCLHYRIFVLKCQAELMDYGGDKAMPVTGKVDSICIFSPEGRKLRCRSRRAGIEQQSTGLLHRRGFESTLQIPKRTKKTNPKGLVFFVARLN